MFVYRKQSSTIKPGGQNNLFPLVIDSESSCLEKLITRKEKHIKLTRFLFSRRFEVIITPLSSDK